MENLTGGCACGAIRYKLTASPLIVHACHCRDCQRVTGSAFVVNIWIERRFVETDSPAPKSFRLAGGSGNPHDVFFCGECGVYIWSRYHGAPGDFLFVRAGLNLPADAPAFESFYKLAEVWRPESLARLRDASGQR